jgi:Mg-chelatase subunit ChlD
VLDASTSMGERTAAGRTKIAAAAEATRRFLDGLRLGSGDQAALVTFNSAAALAQPLTRDRAALDRALGRVQLSQQTRIDLGVATGTVELRSARHRAANKRVLVVLTDGRATPVPADAALREASLAKAQGIIVFTVGIGSDLDLDALRAMASRQDYFYTTVDGEGLVGVFTAIAETIPGPASAFWGRR